MNNDRVNKKEGSTHYLTFETSEERFANYRTACYVQESLFINEALSRATLANGNKELDEYQMMAFAEALLDKAAEVHEEWGNKIADRNDNGEDLSFGIRDLDPADRYGLFEEIRVLVFALLVDEAMSKVVEKHGFSGRSFEDYIAMFPEELQFSARREGAEIIDQIRDEWEEKCSDHTFTAYLNFLKQVGLCSDEEVEG